eukprot:gene44227-54083_t
MEEERDAETSNQPSKLFIGQIPREATEEDLQSMFERFGPIRELTIMRDNATGISKGCAFLTYMHPQSAQLAAEGMHDSVRMPGAQNNLQVRFAETSSDRDGKLFVGMLPKTYSDQELFGLFSVYGEIREVHIIRGGEGGGSKGCAFVKFANRDAAVAAIEALNECIPPHGTRPL